MTIFALGYLGWRDERDRIRAARRERIVEAVLFWGAMVVGVVGIVTGVGR